MQHAVWKRSDRVFQPPICPLVAVARTTSPVSRTQSMIHVLLERADDIICPPGVKLENYTKRQYFRQMFVFSIKFVMAVCHI